MVKKKLWSLSMVSRWLDPATGQWRDEWEQMLYDLSHQEMSEQVRAAWIALQNRVLADPAVRTAGKLSAVRTLHLAITLKEETVHGQRQA